MSQTAQERKAITRSNGQQETGSPFSVSAAGSGQVRFGGFFPGEPERVPGAEFQRQRYRWRFLWVQPQYCCLTCAQVNLRRDLGAFGRVAGGVVPLWPDAALTIGAIIRLVPNSLAHAKMLVPMNNPLGRSRWLAGLQS